MRISARCDYACKALLELALRWPNREPAQISAISRNQDIPTKYLVQILIQLKRLGLVNSVRGKEGGYNLSKDPRDITLGSVMRGIGGPLLPVVNRKKKGRSVFRSVWNEVESTIAGVLDKITFREICIRERESAESFNYQI